MSVHKALHTRTSYVEFSLQPREAGWVVSSLGLGPQARCFWSPGHSGLDLAIFSQPVWSSMLIRGTQASKAHTFAIFGGWTCVLAFAGKTQVLALTLCSISANDR